MARKLPRLQRVLDAPALFSIAYGEIASSIYFALGIIALRALGRASLWEPLGRSLMIDTAKLLAAGWNPPISTAAGLGSLARGARTPD